MRKLRKPRGVKKKIYVKKKKLSFIIFLRAKRLL